MLQSIPNPELLEHIFIYTSYQGRGVTFRDRELLDNSFFSVIEFSPSFRVHVCCDDLEQCSHDFRDVIEKGLKSLQARGHLIIDLKDFLKAQISSIVNPYAWKYGLSWVDPK
jgi:hypothetical protein